MGYWPSLFGQDGWILAKFFFFLSLWTETESKSINSQKRTSPTWSIKDLLYGFWGNFSCGARQVAPSGQDSSILPARVANRSTGFDSSCPRVLSWTYTLPSRCKTRFGLVTQSSSWGRRMRDCVGYMQIVMYFVSIWAKWIFFRMRQRIGNSNGKNPALYLYQEIWKMISHTMQNVIWHDQ